MKKNYLLFGCLGALIAGSLQAEVCFPGGNGNSWDSVSSCCETSSGRFFVRGDLLYWKPHVSGLELDFGSASISHTLVDDVQVFNTEEFDTDPQCNWDAGYRLGAGYQFACSAWELDGFWTHFNGHGSRNTREDSASINQSKFHLKFNQVDVALAYNVCLGSSFLLKPFIGVRGVDIREKIQANLVTDISPALTLPFATETRTFDDHQKFCGVGPLLGFHGDWDMDCGFGIYGTVATSVLYGHDKLHFDDTDVLTAPYSKHIFSKGTQHLHTFNCNLDLALGIRWQTYFCDSFQLITLLGFEHHQYFNLSRLGANRGDLNLDGGTLSVNVVF